MYWLYEAAAGGLLGLGFGFSILSAAELFYFILVRWCYYWYQSKKQPNKQQLVKGPPSYPSIRKDLRGEKTRKLRAYVQSKVLYHQVYVFTRTNSKYTRLILLQPRIAERLPPAYKSWIRNEPENQPTYDGRPNVFHAWVDY